MKNLLSKKIKNEKGIAVLEFIFIMALIGLVISIIGPYFRYWLKGTDESPGFAATVISRQMAGVDQSQNDKKIKTEEGCIDVDEIPIEECQKLIDSISP